MDSIDNIVRDIETVSSDALVQSTEASPSPTSSLVALRLPSLQVKLAHVSGCLLGDKHSFGSSEGVKPATNRSRGENPIASPAGFSKAASFQKAGYGRGVRPGSHSEFGTEEGAASGLTGVPDLMIGTIGIVGVNVAMQDVSVVVQKIAARGQQHTVVNGRLGFCDVQSGMIDVGKHETSVAVSSVSPQWWTNKLFEYGKQDSPSASSSGTPAFVPASTWQVPLCRLGIRGASVDVFSTGVGGASSPSSIACEIQEVGVVGVDDAVGAMLSTTLAWNETLQYLSE